MKVAIVNAVGGVPGLDAHAGAWLAVESWLEDARETHGDVAVDYFGASAGAAVAAVQATGRWTAGGFAYWLSKLDRDDVIRRPWGSYICARHRDAIYNPRPIYDLLLEMLPRSFADLERPLTVARWPG